jgi:hypothetical protein
VKFSINPDREMKSDQNRLSEKAALNKLKRNLTLSDSE